MLNAEFIDLFAECPADDVRRFLLRLAFDEYKIIAVIQIGAVPIDALGIIGDQAVLFLAKDFIQLPESCRSQSVPGTHRRRRHSAADPHLPQG